VAAALGWLVLTTAAVVSVGAAWGHVLDLGQDLQWSPTVLFVEGINPYAHYLAGNPDGRLILEQFPNYAHAVYVLMAPLAALSFEDARLLWAVLNQIASVYLTLAFLCGTAFRTGLANGQWATFTLLAASATLRLPGAAASTVIGLSYLKYSFALPMAAWLWWRYGARAFCWSLVPAAAGYVVFLLHVGGDPFVVLWQPLAVSAQAAYGGTADLMTWIHVTMSRARDGALLWPEYAVPVIVSVWVGIVVARRINSSVWALALLSLTSLLCFRHLVYDWIALLPAAACGLSRMRHLDGRIVLGVVALHWYGMKMLYVVGTWVDGWPPEQVELTVQLALGMVAWRALWVGAQAIETEQPVWRQT
jgi:hypothetical protein